MKNFKKQLKKEALTDTPDLYGAIEEQAESLGLFDNGGGQTVSVGGGAAAVRRNPKPAIYTACAFLLAAGIALGVALPLTLNKQSITIPTLSPIELSVNDFYGAGALSSVKLLSDGTQNVKRTVKAENISAVKEQINYFDRYLSAFDAFLGDGFINTVSGNNGNSQYAQYEKTITVNAAGLDGGVSSYVMYYNETLEKDDGDEKEYVLDGVMTFDGAEYRLRGERSEESEDGEQEEELKIRAYTAANPENYVEMEQEVSFESGEREVEYVYRIYRQNKLVEETEVEFEEESEKGKTEVGFELEFKGGKSKGKYKAEQKNDGTLNVKYNIDGGSGSFTVGTVRDGEIKKHRYLFSDGSEITI